MIFIILIIVFSYIVALLGRNRKFGFWGYFFCSLLLTPLIGLIVVFASDPRPDKQKPGKNSKLT
ncbi:hypothetical protein [Desulfamplus magnetovallimortis]|uniref:hypothetical protein n=1 Tax=Desulfamplus magnetovallimortis TaxID=1246637 RepID=UPI0009BA18E4|nr:hypothetical protein [Desulfamplus magnetovallimortis]